MEPAHYKEPIKRVLEYIEENLSSELALPALARVAGYSDYHFLRLFKQVTGLTPADYIRKRRIAETVRGMEHTGRPISDIAFALGFNSKENFTRAFKTEHGILPTDYKAVQSSLKLYARIDLTPKPFWVIPEIVTIEPFSLVVYPSDEEQPPLFWNKYNAGKWSLRLSGGRVVEDFGVSSWNTDLQKVDYWIGVRLKEAKGDITGTLRLDIPGGLYAVFDTPQSNQLEFISMVHRTWEFINTVWLPESGYRHTGGYGFECYVEDSRTFSERIFIPLK